MELIYKLIYKIFLKTPRKYHFWVIKEYIRKYPANIVLIKALLEMENQKKK